MSPQTESKVSQLVDDINWFKSFICWGVIIYLLHSFLGTGLILLISAAVYLIGLALGLAYVLLRYVLVPGLTWAHAAVERIPERIWVPLSWVGLLAPWILVSAVLVAVIVTH